MKKTYIIAISLLLVSCNDIELIPATSSTIIEKIKSYKGEKAVLLNIWALWCVPCVEEFPMLVEFQKNLHHEALLWKKLHFYYHNFLQC